VAAGLTKTSIPNKPENSGTRQVFERTTQLIATIEALQSVLSHIAHNFRAPLRAVRGYTEILTEEYATVLDARARQGGRQGIGIDPRYFLAGFCGR
jgi:signal transduction histidine kinase